MDLFLRCVAQRFSFLKKIQNFGPFGKPLGQRSRYFTKDPTLWTFLSGAWLKGPWYSTKHPKLWTFLSDTWLRGIDIKIQNSGPFFLRRVVQRFRYLLKFQNCGPFVCRWVRDPDISRKIQNSGPVFRAHGPEVQIFHERSRTVDLVQVVHRWIRGPGIFIKF